MGKRRMVCCSGYNPVEFHEENSIGRRHEVHHRSRLFLCVLCISVLLVLSSAAEDKDPCMPHCWKHETADVHFSDGLLMKQVDKEALCKDLCLNNETCTGVYYGFNPTLQTSNCYFQMPGLGASESLTNATHWILSECSDDCQSYCWKEKWTHIQIRSGVLKKNINTENECKLVCANDPTCNGADWNNTDVTCWHIYTSTITHVTTPDPIHHWEIERNLPTNCTQAREAAGLVAVSAVPVNAEFPTLASGNAAVAPEAAATEMPPTLISTENKTEETNGSHPAGAAIINKPTAKKGPSHNRGGAHVGESRAEKYGASHAGINDYDCPDYMIGIMVMAGLMAFMALIIIGLIAFIIQILQSQPRAGGRKPQSGYERYQSVATTESSESDID